MALRRSVHSSNAWLRACCMAILSSAAAFSTCKRVRKSSLCTYILTTGILIANSQLSLAVWNQNDCHLVCLTNLRDEAKKSKLQPLPQWLHSSMPPLLYGMHSLLTSSTYSQKGPSRAAVRATAWSRLTDGRIPDHSTTIVDR